MKILVTGGAGFRQPCLQNACSQGILKRLPGQHDGGSLTQFQFSLDRKAGHLERRRAIAFRNDTVAEERTAAGDADVFGIG
jgi:hypothetical protein